MKYLASLQSFFGLSRRSKTADLRWSHHSEDGGERPVEEPGEGAIMVVELAANPGLGSGLVVGEGVDGSRAPRVSGTTAVTAVRMFQQLWAIFEILLKPLVLEEEALVAEAARGETSCHMDVGDVLPASEARGNDLELAVSN